MSRINIERDGTVCNVNARLKFEWQNETRMECDVLLMELKNNNRKQSNKGETV